jgi:hypothetical protein
MSYIQAVPAAENISLVFILLFLCRLALARVVQLQDGAGEEMKINPLLPTTTRGNSSWEWVPADFRSFVQELSHIASHCKNINHLALYRGHRQRDWLIDCTFVRHVKEHILGVHPTSILRRDYRLSSAYQRLMGELFLYKFGTSTAPHSGLLNIAEEKGLDPWFEYMKRIQQYPKEDIGQLRGSFLIDWSQRPEIGAYFANDFRRNDSDGAILVADIAAIGAVLHQDIQVGDILQTFEEALHSDKPMGLPLVFYPRKQIACARAKNQDAVYIAQMDLRCDLAEIWKKLESERQDSEIVFLKLILPRGTVKECAEWLEAKGIDEAFIYPDRHDKSLNKVQ